MFRWKNYLTKNSEWIIEVNSKLYLESLEKSEFTNEEELGKNGFVFVKSDNSYNYEDKRELSQTMERDLFMRKNPKWRGFQYAVNVYLHNWWDVRGNYSQAGVFKTNEKCFEYLIWLCDWYHMTSIWDRQNTRKQIEEIKKGL